MISRIATFVGTVWLVSSALVSCGVDPPEGGSASNNANNEASVVNVNKVQTVCSIPSFNNEEWQRLWKKFSSGSNYRLAGPEDFKLPEAALTDNNFRIDMKGRVTCPVLSGDFNNDGNSNDFAVLAVNADIHDESRFSLLIFTTKKDDLSVRNATPQWVRRDEDLSRDYLVKSRAGLSLMELREDGPKKVCTIVWNEKTREFSC